MELDNDRIDEAVLALLFLGCHEGSRTWKSFDWAAMERLHAKGLISDPVREVQHPPALNTTTVQYSPSPEPGTSTHDGPSAVRLLARTAAGSLRTTIDEDLLGVLIGP